MNERIRELAKNAGFSPFDSQSELVEKFAELIVRECLTQIEKVQQIQTTINPGPEYIDGFNDGMFVAIRTIQEHFGVEE